MTHVPPDALAAIRTWVESPVEEHGLLRGKPPALVVGQVWRTSNSPHFIEAREIVSVTSEGISWRWPGWQSVNIWPWAAWNAWQQRHAAVVQHTEENERAGR